MTTRECRRFRRTALVAGVLTAVLVADRAAAERKPPKPPLEVLKGSHRFGAKAGRGWNPTSEALAFASVMRGETARDEFASLLDSASPSGRLYGLCGLHRLHDPRFKEAALRVSASKDNVETINGCFGSKTTLTEVLRGASEEVDSSPFLVLCQSFL